MLSLLLLALLTTSDDTALEAKLKKLGPGDLFTQAGQLPPLFAPWKVRQAVAAKGRPDCRAYGFLLEGEGAPPWVVMAVFCGKSLVRAEETKDFVDWPIMANFESCTSKLRLGAVDALTASSDVFWLSETSVCDRELLAEEFVYEAKAGRLAQQLKAVCADPAAGKTAIDQYRSGFEGKAYPKPFTCNSIRFEFVSGRGYQAKY